MSAYTQYLGALDSGALPTKPAPPIAKQYYRLGEDATIRDVVLHVRADECCHREMNHALAEKYKYGDVDSPPAFMKMDANEHAKE